MSAAIERLAARVEQGIAERAAARVDEALALARDAAFRAYVAALRPSCGLAFEVHIADVMSNAEKELRSLAIESAQRIEVNAVLKRLSENVA